MEFVEKYGRTVEEAAELAAADLGLTINDVEIEVLEEPSKGFLGLGARSAKVRITPIKTAVNDAVAFIEEMTKNMGLEIHIVGRQEDNIVYVDIDGKDSGTAIGKRGQTLDAIQYLTNLAVNKNSESYVKVVVNAENYREKRQNTLEQLAIRLAGKVYKSKKSVRLEPMNPYERKVIHTTLQDDVRVSTKSEGEEPYRRVIIEVRRG
mgnify:CR=1 FL=1